MLGYGYPALGWRARHQVILKNTRNAMFSSPLTNVCIGESSGHRSGLFIAQIARCVGDLCQRLAVTSCRGLG